MAAIENWLINLIGEKLIGGYYLWVLEIFLIVVFSFIAGYLINKYTRKACLKVKNCMG